MDEGYRVRHALGIASVFLTGSCFHTPASIVVCMQQVADSMRKWRGAVRRHFRKQISFRVFVVLIFDKLGVMASSPSKKASSKSTAYCSAIHCRNRQNKRPDLSFFRFPRDPERSRKWIQNTGRKDLLIKFDDTPLYLSNNCRLCSEHFETSQFSNKKTKNRLNWNAVPTIFKTTNPPKRGNPRSLVKGSSETPQAVLKDTNTQEGQLSNTQTEDQLIWHDVPAIYKPSPPESATPHNLLSRETETSQSVFDDTNKQTGLNSSVLLIECSGNLKDLIYAIRPELQCIAD
ncbi:uncharacterized protein [Diadema antillarum]|uniref:uncharacterized protein n=1 Tax=Diadema antillarum TaxID=105358 RepID=UPI003A844A8C